MQYGGILVLVFFQGYNLNGYLSDSSLFVTLKHKVWLRARLAYRERCVPNKKSTEISGSNAFYSRKT